MRPAILLASLQLLACAASYRPLVRAAEAPAELWIRDVRVFTGHGAEVLEHQDLWISGGRIRALVPTGTRDVPAGARVHAPEGAMVVPGLVDTHVHVLATATPPWRFRRPDAAHNLEAWLAHGVTTVVDLGGPPADLDALAKQVETGELPGPRIVRGYTPFTAPGGHPVPAAKELLPWPISWVVAGSIAQLDSEEAARAAVHEAKAAGSPWVKIILDELPPGSPKLSEPVLRALVAEAHARGMRAFVHVDSNADALLAVRAGADHLAHGVYKEPVSDELVAELKARGVTVTCTMSGFDVTKRVSEGRWKADEATRLVASSEAELEPVEGEAGRQFAENPVLGPFAAGIAPTEVLQANVRRMYEGGVTLLAGSDSPIVGILPGASLHEELRFFVASGMPPVEALLSATSRAARLVSPAPDFGVVAEGARADLLVVVGDPTRSIEDLHRRDLLLRGGRIVSSYGPDGAPSP